MTANTSSPGPARRLCVYCDATEIGGAEVSLSHLIAGLDPEMGLTILAVDRDVLNLLASGSPKAEVVLLPIITGKRALQALRAHRAAIRSARPCILHVSLNRPWGSQWAIVFGLLSRSVSVIAVDKLP